MSWSCEMCGGDRYTDHSACRQISVLERIADALGRIADQGDRLFETTDAPTSTEAVDFAKRASGDGVEIPVPTHDDDGFNGYNA